MNHPYVPNAAPATRAAMLEAIGARDIEDLFADIPEALRLRRPLDLPPALVAEADLARHVEGLMARNRGGRVLSFLGAGCFPHYVPAVVSTVVGRGEFLTAYAGEPQDDHGRFQALFEYASLMGDLLDMDVVTVPTYDGLQARSTALAMAGRMTSRTDVVLVSRVDPGVLARVADFLSPWARLVVVPPGPDGSADLHAAARVVGPATAAIWAETPSYHGVLEPGLGALATLAHDAGAELVVATDPICLGVCAPPAQAGADIVCGDIQSLGVGQWYGGAHGGFLAVRDEPRYVMELPSRLFGLAATPVPGEVGFGDVAYERTSFAVREEGKEWVGTAAALWGIAAGVYLALMGPGGMEQLGRTVLARTRYAMKRLGDLPGVQVESDGAAHFREFVVRLDGAGAPARAVRAALRARGIEPGLLLDDARLLVCVTELHTAADIDRLAREMGQAL